MNIVIHDDEKPLEGRTLAAYLLEKKITDRLRDESERKKVFSETRYDVDGETLRTKSWTIQTKAIMLKNQYANSRRMGI